MPDYGRIITYRSPAALASGSMAASAYAGAVITPYYDSLLVKITAWGREFPGALPAHGPRLREFRIRGVKTNIPFLENVVNHPAFQAGETTTRFSTKPGAVSIHAAAGSRHQAAHLPRRRDRQRQSGSRKGKPRPAMIRDAPVPSTITGSAAGGHAPVARELGPGEVRRVDSRAKAAPAHRHDFARRAPIADGDPRPDLRFAPHRRSSRGLPQLYSLEMWGGATFDVSMRFLLEDPWGGCSCCGSHPEHLFSDAVAASNAVGYTAYPDNVVREFIAEAAAQGIDIFRIFDSLNWMPNMQVAVEATLKTGRVCEAAICYTGDILDPSREKYSLHIMCGWPRNWSAWARIYWALRIWPACCGLTRPTSL